MKCSILLSITLTCLLNTVSPFDFNEYEKVKFKYFTEEPTKLEAKVTAKPNYFTEVPLELASKVTTIPPVAIRSSPVNSQLLRTHITEMKSSYDLKDAPKLFAKFVQDNHKVYKNTQDQNEHYANFVKNLDKLNKLNKEGGGSTTYEINMFADRGEEDYSDPGFGFDY